MHVLVRWHIYATGDRHTEISDAMKKNLDQLSWVMPLPDTYVVKVTNAVVANTLRDNLVGVARVFDPHVYFLMTPVMYGGQYWGWLSSDSWTLINERTT